MQRAHDLIELVLRILDELGDLTNLVGLRLGFVSHLTTPERLRSTGPTSPIMRPRGIVTGVVADAQLILAGGGRHGVTAMRASGRVLRRAARGIAPLVDGRTAPGQSALERAVALGLRGTPGEADHHLELLVAVRGADMVGHDGVTP